ncbi:MAG: hypothetical protein HW416_1587 [Chloroflexi bacterium]|nr:hypothetical protein [Chloroflexota bacterium]
MARPRLPRVITLILMTLMLAAACAPAQSPAARTGETADAASGPARPRGTLKVAWSREPESLHPKFYLGSGMAEYGWTFSSALTYLDFNGLPHPMMAREIPTRDNGDWVVNPDGTMVTTYRLRPNVKWHDGTPVTSKDFVFAYTVYVDPDAPIPTRSPETLMSGVEAIDDLTIAVSWKQAYVSANILGYQALDPLPRHLLEEKYRASSSQFSLGEEFKAAFVGTGPFRIESWDPGSRMVGRANLDWFLGPPKIDVLDIRIITDTNTLMANLLSGEVHMTTSPSVRGTEAALARDQWVGGGQGYLKIWETRLRYMFFQFREVPNWQRAVTDLRVRRAALHSLDRQALVEGLNSGLGRAADAYFIPTDAMFPDVDRAITKYPYDPGQANALLADAGWRRSAPNELLADASGKTLDIDPWRQAGPKAEEEVSIIADYWKNVGINSRLFVIPAARNSDNEFISNFPGTLAIARTISPDNFIFTSDNVPSRELRWAGSNRGSLLDPEIDRLQNLAMTTIDLKDRTDATVALHRRFTEIAGIAPLYYELEVIIARNSVKGPVGNYGPQQGITWNIAEWEIVE